MPKSPISARIDPDLYARLKAWWEADDRDMSYAVELCIARAIDSLESDLQAKQQGLKIRDARKKQHRKSRGH